MLKCDERTDVMTGRITELTDVPSSFPGVHNYSIARIVLIVIKGIRLGRCVRTCL